MAPNKLLGMGEVKKAATSGRMAPAKDTAKSAPMDDMRRMNAEDALRTIARADAHRKDKTLMADVKRLAKDHMRAAGCAPKGMR